MNNETILLSLGTFVVSFLLGMIVLGDAEELEEYKLRIIELEGKNATDVDDYNQLVEDYNKLVDKNEELEKKNAQDVRDYNDLVDKYNVLLEKNEKDVQDYNDLADKYNELLDSSETRISRLESRLNRTMHHKY